jgi:exodeoxyribonuclease VII large subunit
LAVPDRQELQRYCSQLAGRLRREAEGALADRREKLLRLLQRPALKEPQQLLAARRQRLDMASQRLGQLSETALTRKKHGLEVALGKLEALSPVQVLRRGYSLVEQEGRLLVSVKEAKVGSSLKVTLKDGSLSARIESLTGQEG